jgi:hypothetical protein
MAAAGDRQRGGLLAATGENLLTIDSHRHCGRLKLRARSDLGRDHSARNALRRVVRNPGLTYACPLPFGFQLTKTLLSKGYPIQQPCRMTQMNAIPQLEKYRD